MKIELSSKELSILIDALDIDIVSDDQTNRKVGATAKT